MGQRFNKHKFELESYRHPNQHLLSAYHKYGSQQFSFCILEIIDLLPGETVAQFNERLLALENEYILQHKANESLFGYNSRLFAESNRGVTHGAEALTRVKGKKLSLITRQKMSANRQGEKHSSAKLASEQAVEIKILLSLGFRNVNIAAYFNVKKSVINDIKNGGAWHHLEVAASEVAAYTVPDFFNHNQSRLNPADVKKVKYLLLQGVSRTVIAAYLGIAPHRVSSIKSGKTSSHIQLLPEEHDAYQYLLLDLPAAEAESQKRRSVRHSPKGSSNKMAKICEEDVLQIKDLLVNRVAIQQIATAFDVTADCIHKIKSGDNWSHITGFARQRPGIAKAAHPNYKHTDAEVDQIRALHTAGNSTKEIASLLGIEKTFINRVKSGKIRASVTPPIQNPM